jgi:hypothetical protein
MWNNKMKINEFVGETIRIVLVMQFPWYVECHITPHSLRVMALRSWRTLTYWLE